MTEEKIGQLDIIGHSETLSFLESAWKKDRLVHAYLFTGPTGSGKSSIARWLARIVLGKDNLESHPDFTFVERGLNAKTGKLQNAIVIDQVHGLRGRIALGPMLGGWKVALVVGVNRLNEVAANALLKTLEEPHQRTLILLTADTAEAVMPTIRSRCQLIRLGRVSRQEIADGLITRGVDAGKADLVARLASGCPGRALELATDQESLDSLVEQRQHLMDLVESGLTERWQGMEKLIPEKISFNEARESLERYLGLLAELLRDALWIGQGLNDRISHVDLLERLSGWPEKFGTVRLSAALAETDCAKRQLAANVSPKTVVGLVAGSLAGL